MSSKETKEEKQYRVFLTGLGVSAKRDPFPITAPRDVDFWADNKKVLEKLIRAEGDALIFPSSRIHAFYGPLGGGKSFAVSYLANPNTQKVLLKHIPSATKKDFLAFPVSAAVPLRTGMLIHAVYVGMFNRLFSEVISDHDTFRELRKKIPNMGGVVGEALTDAVKSAVPTLSGKVYLRGIQSSQGYKLLTLERSRLGSLKSLDQYVSALQSVAEPLLTKYQRIVIAIDELENLRSVTPSERLFFNDFIRRLHQDVESGLTIVLIFSYNTFGEVENLLQPPVVSRLSEVILFDFIRNKSDVVDYITECLKVGAGISPSDMIDDDAIDAIAADLLKYSKEVTFRQVNKHLHRIFASLLAVRKKHTRITKSVYEEVKKQVPVEDIIKELGRTTSDA